MVYLEGCPELRNQTFNFDYIGATPVQYSLSIPANTPQISKDALGNTKCVLNFYLVAVHRWGEDVMNNIDNLEFFQRVKKWFENQNRIKNFPDMGSDKIVSGVSATTDGYIEATTTSAGRYQMSVQINYRQVDKNKGGTPLRFGG